MLKIKPKLRFPEFDGEWEEKQLSAILEIGTGKSKVQSNESGKYNILGSTGIIGKSHTYDYEGDFILTARVGHYAGKLYKHAGKVNISDNTIYLFNFINKNFIYESLNAFKLEKLVFGSGQPLIKASDLKKLKIRVPVSKEQKKIGGFFSKLDHQIELEEQKLKKLEEQKKGYMQKIFSQELRFKDEKGNYYPEWESRYLNELCLINPKVDQVPNSFLYIDLESVNNGKIEKIKEVNKINAPSRAQRLAKKYDVFYQTVRPYQKNNFINLSNRNDIVVSTGYAQLRPSVQFYYLYSLLLTNSFMNKVLVKCTGTNYPAINSTDLSLIQILSSSVFEEQEKIGNFFSKLDELINKQNQKIDGLKKRKRGFLQKMFI